MRPQSLTPPPWYHISQIRCDWVIVTLGAIGGILAIFALDQAIASVTFTLRQLFAIAPFLLVSVGVAARLKAADAEQLIASVFAGRQQPVGDSTGGGGCARLSERFCRDSCCVWPFRGWPGAALAVKTAGAMTSLQTTKVITPHGNSSLTPGRLNTALAIEC